MFFRFRHLGIKDKSPHASVPPYVRIALHPDKSTLPTKDKSQKNTTVGELLIATFATPTGMIGTSICTYIYDTNTFLTCTCY